MPINSINNVWSFYTFPCVNEFLHTQERVSVLKGFCGSSNAFFIAELYQKSDETLFVLTDSSKKAEILFTECRSFLDSEDIFLFPSRDAVPYNFKSPFGPTTEARFQVLNQLLNGRKSLIIAPSIVLLQKLPPPKVLFKQLINLHCNDEVAIEDLAQWLVELGFHRENQISDIGTFSIRGGIVDIYPFLTEHPYRIEFWGNTIDSIRKFDIFSQKSVENCNKITLFPLREFSIDRESVSAALDFIKTSCNKSSPGAETIQEGIRKIERQWMGDDFEGIEWFFHWFPFKSTSILDYFPECTTIVWEDILSPERRFEENRTNYERHRERSPEIFLPILSETRKLLFSDEAIDELLKLFKIIYFDTTDIPGSIPEYKLSLSEQPLIPKEIAALTETLVSFRNQSYQTILVSPNLGHAERMLELLDDKSSDVTIVLGFISKGFIDKKNQTVFLAESQIVHQPKSVLKRKKRSNVTPIFNFDALSPNDYIVHEDHGIAKFLGIEHITAGEIAQDCMVLLYADSTKIYVPVNDFYKVQKYIGKDSTHPVLSKIGTASWQKLKQKTRESILAMAEELIELYAKRQYLEGITFQTDSVWQKEFEDSFIYDETEDQLNAVADIKKDMESSQPMDRLVCGDVGFGKTEVAIRAAFKAVMSGFQVAVLAPTTILASQHFNTFSQRMRDFPVKLTVLSRFVRPSDIKESLKNIESGSFDIVIGTHRVLSDDVKFKNLGLLIIDEEQRFGVHHKEKIKKFRYKIDVLSLSATPIPRTLQLSLIGARDLSIINTPPRNRLPIETNVLQYHEEHVKTAIENELERGGQVYFVNNKIRSLETLKDVVERCIPQARVIIAHGQMDEQLLERIMKEFIAGRFDVLISTVIIENGLYIPNVNTILVNRADALGLSQLYQLRGRVGRSSEQAYAYFFTPSFKELSDVSLKRLKALEQYTELGSGFQIAMRDLEIRGAGNILGTRQHGFIEAIGFELYCRILQETLNEMKDETYTPKNFEVKIEIPVEAYFPKEYVNDGPNRVSLYQELSSINELENVEEFEKTLLDRFGPFPEPVLMLITIVKIKTIMIFLRCNHLILSSNKIVQIFFTGDDISIRTNIEKFLALKDYKCEIYTEPAIRLDLSLLSGSVKDLCNELYNILDLIYQNSKSSMPI